MGQVVSQSELILHRGECKRLGRGVVCVSGCFDLLHPGHIRLLEQARALGDVLVVAVESDAAVRTHHPSGKEPASGKGLARNVPSRPITPASERAEILAALAAVDYAVEFDGTSPREFLARLRPDIFVRGGAAGANEAAYLEDEAIEALGCKVVRIPLEPGYSTARLIDRIAELPA